MCIARKLSRWSSGEIYTKQKKKKEKKKRKKKKKKHNNYMPFNFEQTMVLLKIIAFSTSDQTSKCKKPIFILMSYNVFDTDHRHAESSKTHSAHVQA